ncbi:hypothetical protein R6Q59_034728 [Mikania micrantha]|uniref:Uncharacterized protein n=1 Tax=Mikania micrantha TaxID=192012 RepID=A0A5N6LE06_9ASTR|nr:hypothetical protein E3N88_43758 [Mikania micrantha]
MSRLSPGLVALACNSSEGIKDGWTVDYSRSVGSVGALAGLPVPSCELGHVALAKASVSWSLEQGALRKAGFTELRKPLARDSGRITCRSTAWAT